MRRIALLALLTALPLTASAQATLVTGLGGTAGYGPSCLGKSDDGSSVAIDLTPYFASGLRFFDRTHTSVFVNVNGNVTFSAPQACYTPEPFPIADQPMIAPYWADVDIRPFEGEDFFGRLCDGPEGTAACTPMTVASCHNPTQNGVWYHLQPGRMVVTWDRVGYYQCREGAPRMSFQLVITEAAGCSGGGDFDVEFRYNRCQWHAGEASGDANGNGLCGSGESSCVPAQAGFDAGNLTDFVEIMGSRTASIHTTLCSMSNVGEPGVWRFQIRSGSVICPDAGMECTIPGAMGVCASGRMNCVGSGTECVADVGPSEERCDALDNDCDGTVDDGGDELCPTGQVCESGVCLASCFELGCPTGQVCLPSGNCIDEGCETIMCPEGERCEGGACVGACDGVTCPAGQGCRGGRCVDLCAGLTCDDCTVCDDGVCAPRCPAVACPGGETCLEDGSCVETACALVECGSGQVCMGGACVDACTGAMCPNGMECMAGQCVDIREVDAGVVPLPDAGRTIPRRDSGTSDVLDGGVDAGRGRPGSTSPGCGCRTTDRSSSLGGLALVMIAIVSWRRRRAR